MIFGPQKGAFESSEASASTPLSVTKDFWEAHECTSKEGVGLEGRT